jgi:hypothetical protein
MERPLAPRLQRKQNHQAHYYHVQQNRYPARQRAALHRHPVDYRNWLRRQFQWRQFLREKEVLNTVRERLPYRLSLGWILDRNRVRGQFEGRLFGRRERVAQIRKQRSPHRSVGFLQKRGLIFFWPLNRLVGRCQNWVAHCAIRKANSPGLPPLWTTGPSSVLFAPQLRLS